MDPAGVVLADAGRLRGEVEADALGLERRAQRHAHVGILAPDDVVGVLDHRHLAAETAVHLAELEADVAAADHQQVLRHLVEVHHVAVGEVGDAVDAGDRQDQRPGAGVEDHDVAAEAAPVHLDGVGVDEAPLAAEEGDVGAAAGVLLLPAAPAGDDLVLQFADLLHVDVDPVGVDAVAGAVAGGMGDVGARQHPLGGGCSRS